MLELPPAEHAQAPAPTEGPRVVPVRRRPDSPHHVTCAVPPSYIEPKKASGNLLFIILLLCVIVISFFYMVILLVYSNI